MSNSSSKGSSRINYFVIGAAVLILLLVLFQFYSLALYPIPWFDDTLFASIGKDVSERGKFYPFIAPFAYQFHEVLTYGPVYFTTLAASFKIFGFGSFANRLVGLIFGLSLCYSMVRIYSWNKKDDQLAWLLAIGLLFDYTLFDMPHLGRMEPMSITFLYVYTYFILINNNVQNRGRQYRNAFIYGLFAALALLTTPRVGILLVPPALILVYRLIRDRRLDRFIEMCIMGAVVLVAALTWIFYAFGSFDNMVAFYKIVNETSNFIKGFSFRDSIFIYQYPAVLAAAFMVVVGIIVCRRSYFDEINIISILSILLFYKFIAINRPYGAFTLPYFYLLAVNSLYKIMQAKPNKLFLYLSQLAVYGLVFAMVSISCFKAYYIFSSCNERNTAGIDSFIKQNIPANSKVVGDDIFYFSSLRNGDDFQYMNQYDPIEVREKYQRESYNYDYLIVSDFWYDFLSERKKEAPTVIIPIDYYQQHAKLELVASYTPHLSKLTQVMNKKQKGIVSFSSYNCKIYKRIKS